MPAATATKSEDASDDTRLTSTRQYATENLLAAAGTSSTDTLQIIGPIGWIF